MSTPLYHTPPATPESDSQFPLFDAAPSLDGCYYLAFTGDHNEADAARIFAGRYGQAPQYIVDGLGGLLLVGPVPVGRGGAS
jgi:hypothetical protein